MRAAATAKVPCRFERVVWSGRNRLSDRYQATHRIAEIVNSRAIGERFVLVGHSHGGSAIAYYLREQNPVPEAVVGSVFLSTPFVALRERQGGKEIASSVVVIIGATLITLFYQLPFKLIVIAWAVVIIASIAYRWIPSRWVTKKSSNIGEQSLSERIKVQQTADLPNGRYLFLRSSGDEAAAALSFAQFAL
jgi:pimeloyl-ACP methyl ester carboxylesterase